jgi:hypothetical protein
MKSGAKSIFENVILRGQISIAYFNITEVSKNDVLAKYISSILVVGGLAQNNSTHVENLNPEHCQANDLR